MQSALFYVVETLLYCFGIGVLFSCIALFIVGVSEWTQTNAEWILVLFILIIFTACLGFKSLIIAILGLLVGVILILVGVAGFILSLIFVGHVYDWIQNKIRERK